MPLTMALDQRPRRSSSKSPSLSKQRCSSIDAIALFFGNLPARHKPAPLEVRPRSVLPRRATQATTKAIIGVRLHDGDARVDLARGPLAFDVTAAVFAAKLEGESAVAVEPKRLGSGERSREDDNSGG